MTPVKRTPITFSNSLRRNKAIASIAVKEYEELLQSMDSIHLSKTAPLDWSAIRQQHPPKSPNREFHNEQKAFMYLVGYQPAFLIKTLQLTEARKRHLKKKVEIGRATDEKVYAVAIRKYTAALTRWQLWQLMSVGVQEKNPQVYQQVIDYVKPFDALESLGIRVVVDSKPDSISLDLSIPGESLMPRYALSLTPKGELHKSMLSASRANELFRDFVCGCMIRAAREVIACLPVADVQVRVSTDRLDADSGRVPWSAIAAVTFAAAELQEPDLDHMPANHVVMRASHQMRFSRSLGFAVLRD